MSKIVRGVFVLLVCCSWTIALQAQNAIQEDLQTLVDGWTDGFAVSARITTAEGTWAAASGLVDVKGNESATPDSRFRIASMSKIFLAVVLLQLAEEEVLTLEDTPADWLDEDLVAQIENADSATLYQMVTMTSGIAEYINDDFYAAMDEDLAYPWTAEEAVTYAYELPALFAPGEGYEYTNTNFVLLQLVIEAATEKPFYQVLRERVLDPLELKDTYTQGQESLPKGMVHGYEDYDEDGVIDDVTEINDGWGLADGGLISTTADLTKFYTALFIDQTLLSEDMLALMTDGGEHEYGTAVEVYEGDEGMLYGHSGSAYGFSGLVYYDESLGAIAVVFYATQAGSYDDIDALFALVAGE